MDCNRGDIIMIFHPSNPFLRHRWFQIATPRSDRTLMNENLETRKPRKSSKENLETRKPGEAR